MSNEKENLVHSDKSTIPQTVKIGYPAMALLSTIVSVYIYELMKHVTVLKLIMCEKNQNNITKDLMNELSNMTQEDSNTSIVVQVTHRKYLRESSEARALNENLLIGLIIAMPGLGKTITSPFFGLFSQKFDPRHVLLCGLGALLFSVIGYCIFAFDHDWAKVAFRTTLEFGHVIMTVSWKAIISSLLFNDFISLRKYFAGQTIATAMADILSSELSGFVFIHTSLPETFGIAVFLAFLFVTFHALFLCITYNQPEYWKFSEKKGNENSNSGSTSEKSTALSSNFKAMWFLLCDPYFFIILCYYFWTKTDYVMYWSVTAKWVVDELHGEPWQVALVDTVRIISQIIAGGFLLVVMLPPWIGYIISVFLILIARVATPLVPQVWYLFPVEILRGIAHGFVKVIGTTLCTSIIQKRHNSNYALGFAMLKLSDLGLLFGSIISSIIISYISFAKVCYSFSSGAIALILFYRLVKNIPEKEA